jgi:hypothetical protein
MRKAGERRLKKPGAGFLAKADDGKIAAGHDAGFDHPPIKPDRHQFVDQDDRRRPRF